eukprot:CAMPEP_0197433142 /NCGR_PEP_ID=MMETSP1175-20131217/1079_1 /TAXON_ID=1003142 /ORGANISM="Triceratium dubium, Strain CCMP147" /LENGTH=311 /DNA_ID=CAMNT_0042961431 /DNA_START=85 /DNA_END=1017 /DNA_ORIENTATION=-
MAQSSVQNRVLMSKCYCENYPNDGSRVHTGTKSATLLEALSRNEPDHVVLKLLDVDTEGMARKGSVCKTYAYYINYVVDRSTSCENYHCEDYLRQAKWQPSDGYDGINCMTPVTIADVAYSGRKSWSTYPLQFALMKERSFAVINAMLEKHKQAIYRGQVATDSDRMRGLSWGLPLHYAASRGKSPEITELLIRAYPQGLDVVSNNAGHTPRDIAMRADDAIDSESLELLMKPTSYWIESEGTDLQDKFPAMPSSNQTASGVTANPPDPFAQLPSSNQIVYESPDSGGSSTVLSAGVVLLSLALVAVFGAW